MVPLLALVSLPLDPVSDPVKANHKKPLLAREETGHRVRNRQRQLRLDTKVEAVAEEGGDRVHGDNDTPIHHQPN